MPVQFKMKLAKVGNSLRVTIPKPVVEGLGLKGGDMLMLSVTDGEIRVRKVRREES
ncbi:MAG: AbrB/MazE/SpoVT family DNA-binding domain-containing protein [Candidatus Bathyarchaeia archaeon]